MATILRPARVGPKYPIGVICVSISGVKLILIQHLSGFIQSLVEVLAEIPLYRFA